MIEHKFDNYFAKKGINVRFNTLGYDENLVYSYVKDFGDVVSKSAAKRSHHVKLECYKKMYYFQPRKKLTGFERLKEQDDKFRNKVSKYIIESQFTPTLRIKNNETKDVTISYKDALKDSLKNIENPILYMSGGADSELVALTLLKMNKSFKPVIFFWTNNKNEVINHDDVSMAIEFCKTHKLFPILKQLNLEQLWETTEFEKLAIDMQMSSSQLVTYGYIAKLINDEFPNHTHLFGGEVRFYNQPLIDPQSNLVFLAKVCPPGYNGGSYQGQTSTTGNCTLEYFASTGIWRIVRTGFSSVTGTWTTTPNVLTYEFLIDTVTDNGGGGALGSIIPSAPTDWAPINLEPTQICRVQIGNGSASRNATFEIWVRSTNDISNICVSVVTLVIEGTL